MSEASINGGTPVRKPIKKCWGCGKEEQKSHPPFRACPECTNDLNILSPLFCSQTCYRDNWSRHKELFHNQKKKSIGEFYEKIINVPQGRKEEQGVTVCHTALIKSLITAKLNKDYAKFIMEGRKYLELRDISTAKKNFRKAMKLDGRLPDAYGDLSTVYSISDQLEESLAYLAGSLERTAFITLTGQFGDERWDASTSTAMNNLVFNVDFAHHICFMLEHLFKEESNGYKKPSWYYQKATLRRVTRFARQELSKKRPPEYYELAKKMTLYHATVVGGFVKKGDFTGLFDIRAAVRNHKLNIDDLEEIEECYRAQANAHPTAVDVGHFKLSADLLARVVKQKRANPFHVRLACPAPSLYEGCWVIVHGLTSPVGKEIYNNKLGLVKKLGATDQDQERLGVKIDGIEDHKSIKAHNLIILDLLDRDFALVSCLAMSAQWTHLRSILGTYLASRPDPLPEVEGAEARNISEQVLGMASSIAADSFVISGSNHFGPVPLN